MVFVKCVISGIKLIFSQAVVFVFLRVIDYSIEESKK